MDKSIAATTLSSLESRFPTGVAPGSRNIPGPDHQALEAIYRAFIVDPREDEPKLSFAWLLTGEGRLDARHEEMDRVEANLISRDLQRRQEAHLVDRSLPDDLHHMPHRAKRELLGFIYEAWMATILDPEAMPDAEPDPEPRAFAAASDGAERMTCRRARRSRSQPVSLPPCAPS